VQSRAADDGEDKEHLNVPDHEIDRTSDGYHSDSEGSAMDDSEEDDVSPDDGEGVTVKDRQDVSGRARKVLTVSRPSTLSTPSVCPSGSPRCTASRAR
jgi:hypothetical protein